MTKAKKQDKPKLALEKAYSILKRPLITEKSTMASQFRQYGFAVDMNATKPQVKDAVEQIFNVKVTDVNTVIAKGKTKRFRGYTGQRSNMKKAYVTLAEGQTIDVATGL